MSDSRSVAITVAVIGAAATLAAALITTKPWEHDDKGPGGTSGQTITIPNHGDARAFLSLDNGPGGTTVNVSGEGFAAGERIVIRFHTDQIGSTTASAEGTFSNVAVVIPEDYSKFAPKQFNVIAFGESSLGAAQAPFTITG